MQAQMHSSYSFLGSHLQQGIPVGYVQQQKQCPVYGSQQGMISTISPQRVVQTLPPAQPNVGPHMVRVGSPQNTTVPYRGVPQMQTDGQLNYSISNRKGLTGFGQPHPAQDPYHPFPPRVQEHIQRRPYSNKELFQDLEGLDMVRVQATRISNLLDRIEILEKEVSRQEEIDKEKDKDLIFWEKQFVGLENNKELSRQQIEKQTLTEVDMEEMHYTEDKIEIESAITMKLHEIEEINEEIAYYKSVSIPTEYDSDSLEVRRLQDEEQRFISLNADYNRELLILTHQQDQD